MQKLGFGYSIKKGIKAAPNQDDFFILKDGDLKILGVMDGHGLYGHQWADLIKQYFPKMILSNSNMKVNI